jgi:hypothetical protein
VSFKPESPKTYIIISVLFGIKIFPNVRALKINNPKKTNRIHKNQFYTHIFKMEFAAL